MNFRQFAKKIYKKHNLKMIKTEMPSLLKGLKRQSQFTKIHYKNNYFFVQEILKFFLLETNKINQNIKKRTKNKNNQLNPNNIFTNNEDQQENDTTEYLIRDPELEQIFNSIKVDDPVKMYLKEIGRIPLLTHEEEKTKSQIVQTGIEAQKQLDKYHNKEIVLTPEQIENCQKEAEAGNIAKHQLVESNYRLVVSIAKRYIGRKVLFLDLIQEGNIGLMRAVEKFDHKKGFRLCTYATCWIKQAVSRAISDQANTIRIPAHIYETMNKIARCRGKLTQDLSRKVDNTEIAKQMNIETKQITDIQMIEKEIISLESSTRDEDDSSLGDFIQDPNAISPHEYMLRETLKNILDESLANTLTDREEQVLKMRYGLINNHVYTLEEIGHKFGVTRERIRQIEAKALRRLRTPSKQNKLKLLYNNIVNKK